MSVKNKSSKFVVGSMAITGGSAIWLLSNMELGTVSGWADVALSGIALYWTGIGLFIKWMERDRKRRERRSHSRNVNKVLNEVAKQKYIRETLAA